jgi:aminopeptidase N
MAPARYTFRVMPTRLASGAGPCAAAVILTLALLSFTAPLQAQRLPGGIVPVHYDLTISPDLAAARFAGEEKIRVRVPRAASTVTLHAAEITFRSVKVTAGGQTQDAKVALDAARQTATFTVARPIPAGDADIAISYDGILNSDLRGLYLSEANKRRYAVTQLEATDARRMFPSFDEPALKATFALTAIIDEGDHAISNGAVVSDTPGPAGHHTIAFETTPKMSTYLVALAVGDFECIEGSGDGIPVRVCATPDKKSLLGFALQSATQLLEYYDRYYAIKYPFKKLDIVAVPDFSAGAMENTAAIFYRETLLLADDNASVPVRKNVVSVLAHEMAHQWFGDVVTMQWWDDIWLNEGFATWMMSKPMKATKPEWNVALDEVSDNQKAMRLDALRSTRPIRMEAATTSEISELFDPIAYEKGAAVLRMLEGWIGEDQFRAGVNAYVEKFKYGNARAEDFWNTLTKVTGKPVDQVMPTFVDQPGVPLLSFDVKCTPSAAEVVLTQERYLREAPAQASSSAPGQTWQMPFCLRTSVGETRCDVLREKRKVVPLASCPAWVMGNAGGRGYYRTAIAPDATRKLARDIAKLSPEERMLAISDEWEQVRAGRHDVGTVLDLAAGFASERTATVMQTLTSILAAVGEDVAADATRAGYRRWVAALLSPALTEIGITPRATDNDNIRSLRATLVSGLGGTAHDPSTLAAARDIVRGELDKPGSVEPTLLTVVVQLAAIEGDAALYDRYLARSKAAVNPEERYQYLYALTAFSNPELVRRTMDLAASADVRSQDAKIVIANMIGNPDTRELAWQLVRDRWTEIQKKTGEFVGNTVIVGNLGAFCDAARADEVERFFATHKVPDADRTLKQAIETVRSCDQFAHSQRPKLTQWLSTEQR